MATEKRQSQRIPTIEPITLNWQNDQGNTFSMRGVLLNLADNGALVRAPQRLELRQLVQLLAPAWQIDTSATVRHIRQRGLQYEIGFELNSPLAAKPARRRWT